MVAAATGAAAILVAAATQPESPQPDPRGAHALGEPVWAVVAARRTGVKERQKNHRREVQENTAAARRGRRNRLRKITLKKVQKLQNLYFPAKTTIKMNESQKTKAAAAFRFKYRLKGNDGQDLPRQNIPPTL